MRSTPLLAVQFLAVLAAFGCGGGGGGSGTPAPSGPSAPLTPASPNDVLVQNNTFNPSTVTVPTGTTVRWTWATCTGGSDPYGGGPGETCVDHSVTWNAGGTASATQSEGTYQRTFTSAGTYDYHCVVHGSSMSGKVVVQ